MGSHSHGRLNVFIGPFLAATVPLRIKIGDTAGDTVKKVAKRQTALAYRNIFVSYSHRDKAIVDICQHYAKAIGDRFLRDCIDLRTGEEWNPKLLSLIERADVFQLFWSSSASSSTYIRQEVAHALTLHRDGFIRPTYWQESWPPPWRSDPDISSLHFERLPFGDDTGKPLREESSDDSPEAETIRITPPQKPPSLGARPTVPLNPMRAPRNRISGAPEPMKKSAAPKKETARITLPPKGSKAGLPKATIKMQQTQPLVNESAPMSAPSSVFSPAVAPSSTTSSRRFGIILILFAVFVIVLVAIIKHIK